MGPSVLLFTQTCFPASFLLQLCFAVGVLELGSEDRSAERQGAEPDRGLR